MSRPKIGDLIPIGSGGYSLLSNITDFKASRESENSVRLYWRDPDDVIVDGNIITKWAGTQIRRKVGNYPVNEKDGELVVDSKIRNQYSTTPFVDSGLDKDTEYYYMAFPYTDKNVFTVDSANRAVLLPTVLYYSYGDENEPVTGGWDFKWVPLSSNYTINKDAEYGKEDNYMYLVAITGYSGSNDYGSMVFSTQNKVNLNGLNEIVVSWEAFKPMYDFDRGAQLVIGLSENTPPKYGWPSEFLDSYVEFGQEIFDVRENSLNVSELNGEYYLYVLAYQTGSSQRGGVKIFEVRGEV